MIRPPKRIETSLDRKRKCDEAMDRDFEELLDNIIAARWGPKEVAHAIHELANAHLQARAGNARAEQAIREANKAATAAHLN